MPKNFKGIIKNTKTVVPTNRARLHGVDLVRLRLIADDVRNPMKREVLMRKIEDISICYKQFERILAEDWR